MCWIKKGWGFNLGKAALLAFFNLVKVAKGKLKVKLELWNFSNNAKIVNRLRGNNMVQILYERKSTKWRQETVCASKNQFEQS
jgi:hypothetical protein